MKIGQINLITCYYALPMKRTRKPRQGRAKLSHGWRVREDYGCPQTAQCLGSRDCIVLREFRPGIVSG